MYLLCDFDINNKVGANPPLRKERVKSLLIFNPSFNKTPVKPKLIRLNAISPCDD
jgi:hypothetical protein